MFNDSAFRMQESFENNEIMAIPKLIKSSLIENCYALNQQIIDKYKILKFIAFNMKT